MLRLRGAHSVAGGLSHEGASSAPSRRQHRGAVSRHAKGPVTAVGGEQVEAGIALSAHDHKGPGYYAPGRVRISPPSFHRPRRWPRAAVAEKGHLQRALRGRGKNVLTVETRRENNVCSELRPQFENLGDPIMGLSGMGPYHERTRWFGRSRRARKHSRQLLAFQ